MAGMSPTQLTLRKLRQDGWQLVQVVEYWSAPAKRRIDLFGFVDVIAYSPDRGWLLVQTTTASNISARFKKIAKEKREAAALLATFKYNKIEIHGWKKVGNRWRVVTKDVTTDIIDAYNRAREKEMAQ